MRLKISFICCTLFIVLIHSFVSFAANYQLGGGAYVVHAAHEKLALLFVEFAEHPVREVVIGAGLFAYTYFYARKILAAAEGYYALYAVVSEPRLRMRKCPGSSEMSS